MVVKLSPTTKIVQLQTSEGTVPARIWEGETETGVPVHAYITRIAVPEGRPPADYHQFETELREQRKPSAGVEAIPLCLIL